MTSSFELDFEAEQFLKACLQLGWLSTEYLDLSKAISERQRLSGAAISAPAVDQCLLQFLLQTTSDSSLRSQVRQCIELGFTLTSTDSLGGKKTATQWLGSRLIAAHRSVLQQKSKWTAVACSRLGRHYRHLPEWPKLADSILRLVRQNGDCLLVSPKTTLSQELETLAQAANIRSIRAVPSNLALEDWLTKVIETCTHPSEQTLETLSLSPCIGRDPAIEGPEQDRILFALSHRIFCLWLRAGGKLEGLAQARLSATDLDQAEKHSSNVYVYVPGEHHHWNDCAKRWLERGAIGWHFNYEPRAFVLTQPCDRRLANELTSKRGHRSANCDAEEQQDSKHTSALKPVKWQICGPSKLLLDSQFETSYLLHCTRGPGTAAKNASSHLDHWQIGYSPQPHPFVRLAEICECQQLQGSATLNRSSVACVSFTALPLSKIQSMRRFRSHLGRWDWEPYGLLIDKELLRDLGARPVIYGDEADFQSLEPDERPYFQPIGKTDWSFEREWRLLGDLDLGAIAPSQLKIFTRSQHEARWLAKTYQWPVIWME